MAKINTTLKSKTIVIAITIAVIVTATAAGGAGKAAYSSNSNAPDFNLKTLDGKQVSLESFKGKPVILWFMATWCPSCVDTANAIKQVKAQYGDKFDVLVIDLWAAQNVGAQGLNAETESDLQAFLTKHGNPDWKGTLDTDRASIKYGITEVDSTVVLDGNGNILLTHLGPPGYQPLKDALAKVIV